MTGSQLDGSFRIHLGDRPMAAASTLGTFANWQVYEQSSVIKVRPDVPLNVACLVACGGPTGWGSPVDAAPVHVGDTAIIMGICRVGINAVQGARFTGASHTIAVDPVAIKRLKAVEFGAPEIFEHITDATNFAHSVTNGQGADSAIVTIAGEKIADEFSAVRKDG